MTINPLLKIWWLAVLALTVWREASNQTYATKLAIAYSILNRVDHPKWWGSSISEVCEKKWQYSSMTAPGDPNLVRWPSDTDQSWIDSLSAAQSAIDRTEPNPSPGSDSYYDISMDRAGKPPKWSIGQRFNQINDVKFFNLDHDVEAPITGHVLGQPAPVAAAASAG